MPKFRVYVRQTVATSVVVEANTAQEAEDKADDPEFVVFDSVEDYVPNSYVVDREATGRTHDYEPTHQQGGQDETVAWRKG